MYRVDTCFKPLEINMLGVLTDGEWFVMNSAKKEGWLSLDRLYYFACLISTHSFRERKNYKTKNTTLLRIWLQITGDDYLVSKKDREKKSGIRF